MELYRYHLPSITSPLNGHFKVQVVEYLLRHHKGVLHILKDNLVTSKDEMKQQANEHRSERSFEEGDYVIFEVATLQTDVPQETK